MNTPHLSFEQALERLTTRPAPPHSAAYHAMYTSEWDALITDPRLMRIPVDDHLVHRGDGVFETLLFEADQLYNLDAHLTRLHHSATRIGLALPVSPDRLRHILADLCALTARPRFLIRLLLGRGPGGFGVDPSESPAPSLYAVAYAAPPPFMKRHPEGARAVFSAIPPKSGGLATIKTCNYLPNVLMKAEAAARNAHFVIGVDPDGFVTESYTENLMAVAPGRTLLIPPPDHHLPGTTLQRVADLARDDGFTVRTQKLRPADLENQSELLILGTTACVTSITRLEDRPFPAGPVAERLRTLLHHDIHRTPPPPPPQ